MADNTKDEAARVQAVRDHIVQRPQTLDRLTTEEVTTVAERVGLVAPKEKR